MKEFSKKYLELLKTDYAGINLTRILDDQEFYDKQIIDSVLPAEKSAVFAKAIKDADVCVDIGFGGGFPLLPLAFTFPNKKFIGFEARGKKAKVVLEIAHKLGLNNVRPMHMRFEEIEFDVKTCVTFKAVSTIPELLSGFTASKEINVFFYKGPSVFELEDLGSIGPGWTQIENLPIAVPSVEGRTLIGYKNVPRGTNKKLVKLSSFL